MDQKNNDKKIWYNGKFVSWHSAQTHVLSQGLNVTGSVFEGIRVYNGKPFYMSEHIRRLFKSAQLLGFTIPYSLELIEDAIAELIQIETGYIRPLAWISNQTPAIYSSKKEVSLSIIALELKSPFTEEENTLGLRLITSTFVRPVFNMHLWQAKASSNYMTSCVAIQEAKTLGYDDALLLDSRGYVAEASGANIFMVKDGALYTPIPDCFLNGITRQIVIKLANKLGVLVVEKHITPQELLSAEEIFLTGTAYEIIPVRQIDDTLFRLGQLTNRLRIAFDELTGKTMSCI